MLISWVCIAVVDGGKHKCQQDTKPRISFYVLSEFNLVFGTSASAPTTASLLTLINDARIAIGKGPVGMSVLFSIYIQKLKINTTTGFINPAIYSAPFQIAFNDITHGGNQGCGMYYLFSPCSGARPPFSAVHPCDLLIASAILVSRQSGADLRDRQIGTPGFTAVKGWDPVSLYLNQSVKFV